MSAQAPLVPVSATSSAADEEAAAAQSPLHLDSTESDSTAEEEAPELAQGASGDKSSSDGAVPATGDGTAAADAAEPQPRWPAVKAALLKWHLPLLIVVAVVLGASWPAPASAANDTPLGIVCIVVIFFISGLKLKTQALFEALSNYRAWLFGILTISGLTCCASLALVHLPLPQKEFPLGLAIFFVMPTTISSCIVLTGQAKGNVALALFLSVATNLLSIVLVPLWLTAVLASASDVTLDVVGLLVRLVLTVLLPLLAGKLAQFIPGVNSLASAHKNALKVTSSLFLCLIPWTKVSTAAEPLRNTPAGEILAVLAIGMAVHVVFLVLNTLAARSLALKWPEQAAVVLAGSQKTLSVAVAVVDAAPAELGNSGLLLLPCLLSHFAQIVMDALLFSVLRKRMQAAAASEPAAASPDDAAAGDAAEGQGKEALGDGIAADDQEVGIALVPVDVDSDAAAASPSAPADDAASDASAAEAQPSVPQGRSDAAADDDSAAALERATANQSAQCRAVLRAVPQPDEAQAPAASGGVPLSQQLRAAAVAAGDPSLGAALERDIMEEAPLQEDPMGAGAPRVGAQFQVAELPQPRGAGGQ